MFKPKHLEPNTAAFDFVSFPLHASPTIFYFVLFLLHVFPVAVTSSYFVTVESEFILIPSYKDITGLLFSLFI